METQGCVEGTPGPHTAHHPGSQQRRRRRSPGRSTADAAGHPLERAGHTAEQRGRQGRCVSSVSGGRWRLRKKAAVLSDRLQKHPPIGLFKTPDFLSSEGLCQAGLFCNFLFLSEHILIKVGRLTLLLFNRTNEQI